MFASWPGRLAAFGADLGNSVSIPVEGGAATVTQLPASLFELKFP